MKKVLQLLGTIFLLLGLVFVLLGTGLVLTAKEPVLLVFAGVGILFFFVGIGMLGALSRQRKLRLWLEQNGRIIDADIAGVQYDTRVRVNGRCPLVLQCQAVNPADGKVYVFESDSLWFDPTPFLENRDKMPVLVDPDNYHRYQVLTEDVLPEQG